MWNPFRPRNFSWGATLLTAEQVTAHLLAAFPAADIDLNDPEYMCLTENNLRDFVSKYQPRRGMRYAQPFPDCDDFALMAWGDKKSTRLNSSHSQISYAVFFFKKNQSNKNI